MCLISSPGEYSLCSANSTEEPWCGERWSPESAPSTTVRAFRASDPTLESATGSRYRTLAHPSAGLDDLEQAIDQVRRRHPLGLALVVHDQAVLERRVRQRPDVVGRDREAPVEDRARLAGQDQVL